VKDERILLKYIAATLGGLEESSTEVPPTPGGQVILSRQVVAVAVAAAIGIGGLVPTMAAAAPAHWSKTQCQSWQKSFLKRNPHATKARKAQGNKVLKQHGCSQRIK
jgi:hypothetical protein